MADKKFYQDLGRALTHFRKKARMTQQEVADKMGITKASVSHYETGTRLGIIKTPSLSWGERLVIDIPAFPSAPH